MLDNLFEGRFILGVGAGVLRSDAEALGLLDADRQAMFVESIDQVLAIWAGQAPYDIKGKFWNISTMKTQLAGGRHGRHRQALPEAASVHCRHRVRSRARKGVVELGKRGWGPVSSKPAARQLPRQPLDELRQGRGRRRAARPTATIWRVARSIFVAEDSKVAKAYGGDDPKSPYRFYMRQLLTKLGKFKRSASFKSRPDMPDEEVTLDYVLENIVIRGTVNEVVDRIWRCTKRSATSARCSIAARTGRSRARPQVDGADGREGDARRQRRDRPAVSRRVRRGNVIRPGIRIDRAAWLKRSLTFRS